MKARYWSFEGRISRGTFWRGILSINALVFATLALVIILPVAEPWNIAAIIPGGLFLIFRTNVLTAQRLHDLGQPMRVFWSPWEGFRWMWAMSFSAGEQGVNAYGPPPRGGGSRLELVVLAGVLLAATGMFRSAGFECKASVSASGSTAEEANARWSEKVERVHGRRFAQSGIKLLTMTTCIDGSCSVSARACAFELAAATDERAAVEAPKRERASESGVAGTQQHSVMPAPAADSNLSNPAPIRGADSAKNARSVQYWRDLAEAARKSKDWQGMITNYNMVIALEPEVADHYGIRGAAHLELAQYERARNDLQWALALDPNVKFAYYDLGLLHLKTGKRAAAEKNFGAYTERAPEDPDGWSQRGWVRSLLGEKTKGLKDLTKALELNPTDSYALVSRCGVARDLGKLEMARADCKAALEITPDNKNAQFNLGLINFDEQRYVAAEANFSAYLQIESQDAAAWRLRGQVRFNQGNNQGAIDDYTRAIEINPGEIYAYAYRCGVRINVEKFDRAEKDCLAALELDANAAVALNNLAWLYYKTGEYKEGLAYAERAVKANLDEASYWDTRAHLLEGLGEKELAISDFRSALKRNPNQNESIAGLKRLGVEL